MKDIIVELDDLDYARERIKESKGLTALQKVRIFDAIDGAKVMLKAAYEVKPLLSVNGFVCGNCGHLLLKDTENEKLPDRCTVCRTLVGSLVGS